MKLKTIIRSVFVIFLILTFFLCVFPTFMISYVGGANATSDSEKLPSEYCMRDEYILYAQNQDNHGYCWNFAATMAASTTIMKATGEYYDFSELWTAVALYNHDSSFSKMGAGGSFTYQYDAMKKSGLMLETDLPYQHSYTVSNENAEDYYNFYEKYSNDDIASCLVADKESSFKMTDVDKIKEHIYNHGSVYLTFTFRTGFVEKDGVFALEPNQTNTSSNHAISVIGWDDNYQREYYLNGSTTPTVFKGAWIVLNSYTEKNGNDGISFIFYEDKNIGNIRGYRYEPDTSKDFYFYDKIESGYAYPTSVKGKYYGDFTAESALTKQKNIFYDDVNLEYSYKASSGVSVKAIDIYLEGQNVTKDFTVCIDNANRKFSLSKNEADYGQYKLLVTYTDGERSDTYLNNFFVTHGLIGEEIEYDYSKNEFPFNPGRDIEFYSFILPNKNYVIYTDRLSGQISFLPTEQSVYSEKSMSIPSISYEITNGKSCVTTYKITSNSGYELEYKFTFVYCADKSMETVNVYYDLGRGVNHSDNYGQELASETSDLILYAPTRPGYTFAGWYLDYGNGSKKVVETDGVYRISWDDIHHMGGTPTLNASSYYSKYYKNSNTVFVYAHWEEETYHNVDVTIVGEGSSQIHESILVSSNDCVRYLLIPKSGWCLSELKINGTAVTSGELAEISKYGLRLEGVNGDITITATFSEGVYLSLKHGDNIKSVYVIGTAGQKTKKFYDGDYIPAEFFDNISPIKPRGKKSSDVITSGDFIFDDGKLEETEVDKVLLPFGSTIFTLVVELNESRDGYTYVLDNVLSYSTSAPKIFEKDIVIEYNEKIKEIDVGSASEVRVVPVEITYNVGNFVEEHYLSADPKATSGEQNSATYNAGEIVYLFIKTKAEDVEYTYQAPDTFEDIGDCWYRKAILVSEDEHDLGEIEVSRYTRNYTVIWVNWDGSIIYSEKCPYGTIPSFYNDKSDTPEYPVRPDDETYSYEFIGWDKTLKIVTSNVTYTATYNSVPRRYVVKVEPAENGTVSPDGNNYINRFDIQTYIFTPNQGYRIKDVIINGESVGAVSSYTFVEVSSDQTVKVEFEKIKYSVNILLGDNGSADLTGVLQVEHGSNVTVNITPIELFAVDFIKVNGVSVEVTNCLTVSDIVADTIIEITFKQMKFNITTTATENGKVTPSLIASAGESVKLDFCANIGYRVKDVKIDGVSVGAVDNYTFVDVQCNHSVSVEYELDILFFLEISVVTVVLVGFAILSVVVIKKRKGRR